MPPARIITSGTFILRREKSNNKIKITGSKIQAVIPASANFCWPTPKAIPELNSTDLVRRAKDLVVWSTKNKNSPILNTAFGAFFTVNA